MKKNLFKPLIISIILTMVITGCVGPATSKKETNQPTSGTNAGTAALEPVTLIWYSAVDRVMPDTEMVWSEINKYLKEKINVTLEYHFYKMSEFKDKITPIISSGQYFDITFTGTNFGFVANAQRNAFYPIESLMSKYLPETKKIVPKGAWDAVTINGHVYAIPPFKDLADRVGFLYNKTMTDKYKIEVPASGKWTTIRDMIPLLRKAKTARDAEKPELAKQPILYMVNTISKYYPYELLIGPAVVNIPGIQAFKGKGNGETVFNLYATDEYKDACKTIKMLVDERIFPYDHKNFDPDKTLMKEGNLVGEFPSGYIEVSPNMYAGRETALSTSSIAIMTTS